MLGISGDIFKSFLSRAQIRNIVYRSDSYCNLFLLCSLPYLTIPGLCRLSHPTYPTGQDTWDTHSAVGHQYHIRTGQDSKQHESGVNFAISRSRINQTNTQLSCRSPQPPSAVSPTPHSTRAQLPVQHTAALS